MTNRWQFLIATVIFALAIVLFVWKADSRPAWAFVLLAIWASLLPFLGDFQRLRNTWTEG